MASVSTDSVSPFSIYENHNAFDEAAEEAIANGDRSFLSDSCDIPLASIENDPPLSPTDGRRTSGISTSSVSSFPSELSVGLKGDDHNPQKQFTPMKMRAAFRNPSSVKAMQMASPPQMSPLDSPRTQRLQQLTTPVRRSETPRSRRSQSIRSQRQLELHASARQTPPVQEPQRQQYPLVLLHMTLLPLSLPYPAPLLETVLPQWLLENFRLLESKLQDSVLMSRGLLIPHPRHEYDLLEERLLESLDLATPRLLKSGHFHGRTSGSFGPPLHDEESEDEDDSMTARGSVAGTEDDEFGDLCKDCSLPLGLPGTGAGTGKRRWEVKIYAANGLMRAGAWGAAWTEMERVDVEVVPWIPEDLKRRLEDEAKMQEEKRQATEQAAHMIAHGIPTPPESTAAHSRQQSAAEDVPDPVPGIFTPPESVPEADSLPTTTATSMRASRPRKQTRKDVPLSTALANYLYLLSQDRRNWVLLALSFLVLILSLKPTPAPPPIFMDSLRPIVDTTQGLLSTPVITSTQFVTLVETATVREIVSSVFITSQMAPESTPVELVEESTRTDSTAATVSSVFESLRPVEVSVVASESPYTSSAEAAEETTAASSSSPRLQEPVPDSATTSSEIDHAVITGIPAAEHNSLGFQQTPNQSRTDIIFGTGSTTPKSYP